MILVWLGEVVSLCMEMYSSLDRYKILAFVCALKRYRRNSTVYAHESFADVAKAIGICLNTFKKRMNECLELSVVLRVGRKQHYFVKSIPDVIEILFPDDEDHPGWKNPKHVRFFGNNKYTTVKEFYEAIKLGVAMCNFQQQQYKIDKRKQLKDFLSTNRTWEGGKGYSRKMMGLYRKSKQDSSLVEGIDNVVTGCIHLSKLLGCCRATAGRLLRLWNKTKKISRTIVVEKINMVVSHASFDYLKQTYSYLVPIKGYWYAFLGSVIKLPALPL